MSLINYNYARSPWDFAGAPRESAGHGPSAMRAGESTRRPARWFIASVDALAREYRAGASIAWRALKAFVRRPPDFVIGEPANPYMLRWWIIPRNRWFNIYLHKILRSDDDRALHDHPWWNCSILLKGEYREILPSVFIRKKNGWAHVMKVRRAGSIVLRPAHALHRLEVSAPCWSLFLTGPKLREWGFQCPRGWMHWRDFTAGPNGETIGRGCGEP